MTDGTFNLWDAKNLKPLGLAQYDGVVSFIVFSLNGRMMATGGTERVCRV
ncbi:hypothetical protein TRAPUB_7050 [Trametes pubescens]|uniref:Uncharacterized protein n=1 Tax=Trametes pubescens TaxID=154538 RepID=A0A1M2V4E7_TRAPU|nr:hypothetical protein TRAPUB_7050 [Trametes pubescens]